MNLQSWIYKCTKPIINLNDITISRGKKWILLCCLPIVFIVPQSFGASKSSIAWLKIPDKVKKNWSVEYDKVDSSTMYITPIWLPRDTDIKKSVLGILPKKSSSYKMAVIKLLEVFYTEGIRAEIVVKNFAKKKKRGIEILNEAEKENIDLIFSMGSESAALVHDNFKGHKIPVVTSTNKDPVPLGQMKNYTEGSHTNIATTSLNVPLDIQLNYLLQLIPNLKNIGLMYNKNHKQVMATEVVPAKREFTNKDLNVIDVAVESRDTSKEKLTQLMPIVVAEMRKTDPDLKRSVFWITSSTAIFSQIETINQYSDIVPVIGSVPNIVKEGDNSAVVAIGIDRRNNAHLASIYAVRILRGEVTAGELKVGVVTPPDVAINFKVTKKSGLKIPFRFFESAAFIYDYDGKLVRSFGEKVIK